jgi:WD40 repeat protein
MARKIQLLLLIVLLTGRLAVAQDAPQIPSLVLSGHEAGVTGLAWSPDGKILASTAGNWDSTDFTVRLWNTDGTLVAGLEHEHPVSGLAWSPDGSILATGAREMIHLWSLDGTLLNRMEVGMRTISSLDWSPDGLSLASASLNGPSDNLIQVWSADGELLHTLSTQYSGGKFLHVGWSPDGAYLVGGAVDYKEWQTDGTLVFTHEGCSSCTPAWGFAWSPDSAMWAIGDESGYVWVYAVDGEELGYLHNGSGNVDVLAWSPDGSILAGGNILWQLEGDSFEQAGGMTGGRIRDLSWSPDSTIIAVAYSNKDEVRLWNTDSELLAVLTEHTGNVYAVTWSPDGTLLASASNDSTIRLWDVSGLLADEA